MGNIRARQGGYLNVMVAAVGITRRGVQIKYVAAFKAHRAVEK